MGIQIRIKRFVKDKFEIRKRSKIDKAEVHDI